MTNTFNRVAHQAQTTELAARKARRATRQTIRQAQMQANANAGSTNVQFSAIVACAAVVLVAIIFAI